MSRDRYIPALSYGWLTSVYDPVLRWAMRESTFKPRLVEQARVEKGDRVLDLGCGTATLTILLKKAQPEAEVIGLDGDPRVLEIARAKVLREGLRIPLNLGMAFALPYADNSFDCVLSSLVLHHLTRENKARTLREVFRILRPGGALHLADFARPHNALMHLISLPVRRLEEASDNVKGLLPEMMRSAGLDRVEETTRYATVFGALALYRARKPR